MRFEGQVALISAAGAGIGRATAEIIAREGGTIVAVDTDAARLDGLAAATAGSPGRVLGQVADALDPAQVARVVKAAQEVSGRIDILVNAVGGSTIIDNPAATVDELSLADWQRLIAFNLDGTYLFCNAVAPACMDKRPATSDIGASNGKPPRSSVTVS